MFESVVASAPVILLVAVRCFALIRTLPLFSSRTVQRIAKVALAGYMAYAVYPLVSLKDGPYAAYASYFTSGGGFTQEYIFALIGEGLIGIMIGFFVTIIFAAFSTAGQFFSFQMGFSASQVYDSMSEVENPLMGEYFNFLAMLVFLQNHLFNEIFLKGLVSSFKVLNVFSLIDHSENLALFMMQSLTKLFGDALVIALPLMGTLFLINVCMGVLSKAAPTMNLMAEGFPILILTSFGLLVWLLPKFMELFADNFVTGFSLLEKLFLSLGGNGA